MSLRPGADAGGGDERTPVDIQVVEMAALDETLVARWQAIQDRIPAFASPFLGPGWARLVADCGRTVRVAILRRNGVAAGFFPFELVRAGHGKPVGTVFCDYQAVVVEPDVAWDVETLLSACGLRRWDFDHLLKDQAPFARYHLRHDFSPVMDLSSGFEAYRRRLAAEKRRQLTQAARRRRQIQRALGPVTFTAHDPDADILDRLLALKGAQWASNGWSGRFEAPWERALTAGLMLTDTPAFGGLLSVLSAGRQPLAIHLGPRSRTIWHYWITAYDPTAARFSPGIVLLEQMAQAAPSLGLGAIDLGKGNCSYKCRFMTEAVPLAEGTCWRDSGTLDLLERAAGGALSG
jgi:CelD/BcsL family acetyltransferase involved in cellulose biosynthesis